MGDPPPPSDPRGASASAGAPRARPDLRELIEQLRQAGWYVIGAPQPGADEDDEAEVEEGAGDPP